MDDKTLSDKYASILSDMGLSTMPKDIKMGVLNALALVIRDRFMLELIKTLPPEKAEELSRQIGIADPKDIFAILANVSAKDMQRIDGAVRAEIAAIVHADRA